MPDLKLKLAAIELKLAAGLEEIRAELNHKGNKGSRVEEELRTFLREHLPKNYSCGQGEIIDSTGANSKQIDVIITNQYHPFNYSGAIPGLYLIEGIAAVGEVKSILDRKELESAISNALALRSLNIDPGVGTTRSIASGDARFFESPPYFVFAFESSISIDLVDEILVEATEKHGRTVDAVFILNRGHSIDFGDGNGSIIFQLGDGSRVPGWLTRPDSKILIEFLGWLHACMPLFDRKSPVLPPYLFGKLAPLQPGAPPIAPIPPKKKI